MDPHVINLEMGVIFETGSFYPLTGQNVDQIDIYYLSERFTPMNDLQILNWPANLN